MPFSSPEGSVWQHIANPTPDSENSDFSTIMMWRWFFNFWPKSKKKNFCRKKLPFFTFRWYLPFSMPFLSSQTSLFAPNFRNQVRKPDFGRGIPLRLNTLQKAGKNQKTVLPDTFCWFDGFHHTK